MGLILIFIKQQQILSHKKLLSQHIIDNPHQTEIKTVNRRMLSAQTTHIINNKIEVVDTRKMTYKEALTKVVSAENVVIIALIDYAFTDMAVNFYETFIAKHNISHYMLVSVSKSACQVMYKYNINCFTYYDISIGNQTSSFMQGVFLKKMALRTKFIWDALQYGYNIIHTDIDVVFLKDPTSDLLRHREYDIQALEDMTRVINAGFLWLKPTATIINIYEKLTNKLKKSARKEDQSELNKYVNSAKKHSPDGKCLYLKRTSYLNGRYCFEYRKTEDFLEDITSCKHCMVCHNNWIVSKAAKIYRFKEVHVYV